MSRIVHHPTRPHLDEMDLSRTLELAAAVLSARLCSVRVISGEHKLVQHLHRGHYKLGVDADSRHRIPRTNPDHLAETDNRQDDQQLFRCSKLRLLGT